ncbi:MAG: acyltransferase family protein [Phycisphaerae bacterium]
MAKDSGLPASQRLVSLDALRGFDMFWIVAAEGVVRALHTITPGGPVGFVARQLQHVPWQGLRFYDLIFALFVFIVGVSMVFSLSKSIKEAGTPATYRKIVRRALLMFLLGIFYYGGLSKGIKGIRLLGVLQRIALAYLFSGLIFTSCRPRGMVIACVSLLVGYWAMMMFVPVPGVGTGCFEPGRNLAHYVDSRFLPLKKYGGTWDPEGLLSTIPAIGTCLIGVFAGLLLKRIDIQPQKKVLILLGSGVAGVALGYLWGMQFPIIKVLWTSSYVLAAGGYSCILLAVFYQVVDIWQFRRWAIPFVWIGMNSITIYVSRKIIDYDKVADRLVGGPIKAAFGRYDELVVAITVALLIFALARFLYRRQIFLRL